MKRWLLLLVALPAFGAECTLEYRFTARFDAQPRRFEVELRFDSGDRTVSQLRSTPEWGGVTDFDRAIRNVRSDDASVTIGPGDEPRRTWKVSHPKATRVSVKYDAVNDVADVDADTGISHRDFYRNMVGEKYFHLFGWAMLLAPEHVKDSEPIDTCISFAGLPSGWALATSLGEPRLVEGIRRVTARLSPLQLRSALYLGGDFRIYHRDIEGRPLAIALRGQWQFDDATFVEASASIVRAHREFWRDYDFPYYIISLLPNRLAKGSYGGTGLDRAFAMHASSDFSVPGPMFEHLIGHEDLHAWVPRRIGSMGANEAHRYWFSEGFTDYLNHRLLLASRIWSLEDYAAALNRIVLQYFGSRARNATNDDIAEDFWKDPAANRMPYLRGELLALRWDAAMSAHGSSLQSALRKLRRDGVVISSNDPKDLATARLLSQLRADIGEAVDRDVDAYVEDGDTIPVDAAFLGACFVGKHVVKSRPGIGYARPGIVPVVIPRPTRPLERGTTRDSFFVPRASGPVDTVEFHVAPAALEDAKCKRWIEAD